MLGRRGPFALTPQRTRRNGFVARLWIELASKGSIVSSIEMHGGSRAVFRRICCIAASAALLAAPAHAAADRPGVAHASAYADLADLALAAPVVLAARVRATIRVPRKSAPGLADGARRYLIRADVARAIVAPGPVPSRIEYLWDVASETRPDIDDRDVLLFLKPVAGRSDQFSLVKPQAQIAADAGLEARVRTILKEAHAAPAHKAVTVTRAFTVPGSVPGEAETQIFLASDASLPTSLVIVSRPGEAKRWTSASGDTIDTDAPPPARDTLAWYTLACGLPRALPPAAVADLDAAARAMAAADYAFVLAQLGPCRGAPPSKEASSTPTETVSG